MMMKRATIVIRLRTVLAFVRFIFCVSKFVVFEAAISLAISLTNVTYWWIVVKVYMDLQIGLVIKSFLTKGTTQKVRYFMIF